jgi:putative FmdB family regulatory protein
MPTYEYICRACGHEFEEFHSIKADPISVCPKCRKKKVERKISTGGAVIFKGGGFYETDYRSDSYKSGADADKKAGEGKSEAGTDAKPAPEAKPAGKPDAKPAAKVESAPQSATESATTTKPATPPAPKPDSAAAAENKRIEARATHQSRIGRGIGNIVKKKAPAKKKR